MELSKRNREILSLFNENKLLILLALYKCKSDVCGCDLVGRLNIPKNLVSYHIRTLRESGYIEEARCGKNKVYRIVDGRLTKVVQILRTLDLM